MKNLKKIIKNDEMQDLVDLGRAEYLNFGPKREEIVFIGNMIYYQHTNSHYGYIGERKPWVENK